MHVGPEIKNKSPAVRLPLDAALVRRRLEGICSDIFKPSVVPTASSRVKSAPDKNKGQPLSPSKPVSGRQRLGPSPNLTGWWNGRFMHEFPTLQAKQRTAEGQCGIP